jgi:VCBS repeat-containing protein
MNISTILENLSEIYHNYDGWPRAKAMIAIKMYGDLICEDIASSGTQDIMSNEHVNDFAITTISQFSDFYQQKQEENKRIEKSMMQLVNLKKNDKVVAMKSQLPKVDQDCLDRFADSTECGAIQDIDIRYSGLNFQVFVPGGDGIPDEWVPNHTIELSKQGNYFLNYVSSDSSGHPLAIQTSQEPFDADSAIVILNVGDRLYADVPDSGIFISGIEYKRLYYTCASGNLFGHPSIQNEIDIQIIGTNDAPIITDIKDSYKIFAEEIDATGQILMAGGKLTFQDLDYGDSLTPIVQLQPGPAFGPLTAISNITVSGNGPSGTIVSKGGAVEIDWSYNYGPADLDQWRYGQVVPIKYSIKLTDGHATSNAANINLYLLGTNDPVVIETGLPTLTSGIIYELPADNPAAGNFLHSTQGYMYFEDKDLGDSHSAFYHKTGGGDYGVLGLQVDNANSRVRWVYDVYDWEMNPLRSGEVVRQEYFISIYDRNDSVDNIVISIDLVGADDIVAQNEPMFSTLIEKYTKQTGVYEKITNEPIYISDSWWPSSYDQSNDISFITDVNYSGYTSGIPFGSGDLLRMFSVDVSGEDPDKKIVWQFDSKPEAFDYLPHGKILNIKYVIDLVEDQEGGIIDIKDAFIPTILNPRPHVVLGSGDHDYIDEKYWKRDEDVPCVYGGLNTIRVTTSRDSYCWDAQNFKYYNSGLYGTEWVGRPSINSVMPFYPLIVPEPTSAGFAENGKDIYQDPFYVNQYSNKKYELKIGYNKDRTIAQYDSPGDINGEFQSTKWPSEKVTLSIEPQFNGLYPYHNSDGLYGILDANNNVICGGKPVSFRNISLVDIRVNTYPTVPRQLGGADGASYAYYNGRLLENILGGIYLDSEFKETSNYSDAWEFYNVTVLVQNRQFDKDAGHAYMRQVLSAPPGFEIVSVDEVARNDPDLGPLNWSMGASFEEDNFIVTGSIRGLSNFTHPCRCDAQGNIIPEDYCGCDGESSPPFFDSDEMAFPYGLDPRIKVGMVIRGPWLPLGTTVVSIHDTGGQCDYIKMSNHIRDIGADGEPALGPCSYLYGYSFSEYQGQTSITLNYPLRSNKPQLYDHGYYQAGSFASVFVALNYYEVWLETDLLNSPAIRLRNRNPPLFPSPVFTGSTGWVRSDWDVCYRPVSYDAVIDKLDVAGSLANYTYSARDCKGLFPYYNDAFTCPNLLCSPPEDPCCVNCESYDQQDFLRNPHGNNRIAPCFSSELLDSENQSFFNFDIDPTTGYFIVPESGTGHAGNSYYDPGILEDPIGRPPIEGDYAPFLPSLWGFVNPSIEVTRNFNKNFVPETLDPLYHPQASIIGAPTSDDLFSVYSPHGLACFVVTLRSQIQPFHKETDKQSCQYNFYAPGSQGNFQVSTILTPVHINVTRNIMKDYIEGATWGEAVYPTGDMYNIYDNSYDTIVPPTGNYIITNNLNLTPSLYRQSEFAYFPDDFGAGYINVRRDFIHTDINVGDTDNPWYCYERPEAVRSCESGDGVSIRQRPEIENLDNRGLELALSRQNCCVSQSATCGCGALFDSEHYDVYGFPYMNPYSAVFTTNARHLAGDYNTATFEVTLRDTLCDPTYTWVLSSDFGIAAGIPDIENWDIDDWIIKEQPPGALPTCCELSKDIPCPIYKSVFLSTTYSCTALCPDDEYVNQGIEIEMHWYYEKTSKSPGSTIFYRFKVSIQRCSDDPISTAFTPWAQTPCSITTNSISETLSILGLDITVNIQGDCSLITGLCEFYPTAEGLGPPWT